ncbi:MULTISPECIES: hypothetical protein [unclassified Bartonella]|uniref:hypothetical protein n=1 Tax=unclassified Bartonella TaxID=2645622 RepID=UPI0035D00F5E
MLDNGFCTVIVENIPLVKNNVLLLSFVEIGKRLVLVGMKEKITELYALDQKAEEH